MRLVAFVIVFLAAGCLRHAEGGALRVRALSSARVVDDSLIVGRAVCGDITWLLTELPGLVRVSVMARQAPVHRVRGFLPEDRPWGLACLADGTLWTLAAPGTLARLAADGAVAERIALRLPWLTLFGVGERLLFQEVPVTAGRSVLATRLPRKASESRPWPGLIGRSAAARRDQLVRNFLTCGIGTGGFVPCWFTDQSQLTISDGSASHTTSPRLRLSRGSVVDEANPIWDVALAGPDRMWVLTALSGEYNGRRAGGRLARSNRRAEIDAYVDLNPPARMILAATERGCVLLSARGELVEVADR